LQDALPCDSGDEPIVTPLIQGQLQIAAAGIPEQATLVSADPAAGKEDARQQLKVLRLFLRLTPTLPLLMLFALTVLAVRSLRDWLMWWGAPFFVTGILASLMAWLGAGRAADRRDPFAVPGQ